MKKSNLSLKKPVKMCLTLIYSSKNSLSITIRSRGKTTLKPSEKWP
ncbi:hypothetical protein ADICYQ_2323 [Cyclobacterium qasimii M12-11B]|uniref:Uncharacterized protein n=1 Tax=Cyclobacterium qasimii M12-11B TaxID=641524 RepID=S7VF25_9BACT|nr:hypothetical protein ADICYQ_2323 [Cyclobacterium qasimii M12-11B]